MPAGYARVWQTSRRRLDPLLGSRVTVASVFCLALCRGRCCASASADAFAWYLLWPVDAAHGCFWARARTDFAVLIGTRTVVECTRSPYHRWRSPRRPSSRPAMAAPSAAGSGPTRRLRRSAAPPPPRRTSPSACRGPGVHDFYRIMTLQQMRRVRREHERRYVRGRAS